MGENNVKTLLLKNDEVYHILKFFGDDVNYHEIDINNPIKGFTIVRFEIDTKKRRKSKKIKSISDSLNSTNLIDLNNACV